MLSGTRKVRPKTIDLNLIPLELRRPFFTRLTLLLLGAILLGAALYYVIDNVRAATEWNIYDLETQRDTTAALIRQEDKRIANEKVEADKVAQELKRLKDDITRYNENPQSRTRRVVPIAPAVDAVLGNPPAGVQLTTLSWQEPLLVLQGKAPNTQIIQAYTDKLRGSKQFSTVQLGPAEASSAIPAEYSFTIRLTVPIVRSAE
ncbi:MAG: PilN domain-containing protein [Chloroflexi bacterium]|nr:PilN domain-containing protein [Chloroflexota bacterium]